MKIWKLLKEVIDYFKNLASTFSNSISSENSSCYTMGLMQESEEGYIEGETHGIVISHRDVSDSSTWNEALDLCNIYTIEVYTDWSLPNIEELKLAMINLPSEFDSDPTITFGYWSATGYLETLAYFATYEEVFGADPTLIKIPFRKTSVSIKLKAIHYF